MIQKSTLLGGFMTNLRTLAALFLLGTTLITSNPATADSQGNADAEKQRIEDKIQQQKIEDQRLEDQRQEQKIIDRKLEDRRLEQKRLDNARQRRDHNEVASRESRRNNADEDRTQNALNQMMDIHRFQYPQNRDGSQSYYSGNPAATNGNTENAATGGGCAGGSCPLPGNNNASGGCANGSCNLNCCDQKFIRNMEAEEQSKEQHHECYIRVIEQWDHDHPRD